MAILVRLLCSFLIILLIAPQTEKENIILRTFHESGLFINYGEAKKFFQFSTWTIIILFLCSCFL